MNSSWSGTICRVRRRLMFGKAAATVMATAVPLTGCAGLVSPPAPTGTRSKITLVLAPWVFAGESPAEGAKLLYTVTEPFRTQYKVNITMSLLAQNVPALTTSIIAGQGPDVLQGCCTQFWALANTGVLLPLDGFVHRDNVDLSVFTAPEQQKVYTQNGHLLALNSQSDPVAMLVNLDLLNQLGLPYPTDTWTWKEATDLWQRCAGVVHGKNRYGSNIFSVDMSGAPSRFYLHGFGGDYVDPQNLSRCTADSTESLAALSWAADLLSRKVCATSGSFGSGQLATETRGSWYMPRDAMAYRGIKWRYYPQPTWPVRAATFDTLNFWSVSATTKQQDLAFELLKFVALSPHWQRGMMNIFLTLPTLKSLLPEWEAKILAVAPVLADKNIGVFTDALHSGIAVPGLLPQPQLQQGSQIIGQWFAKAVAGTASVQAAMRQATTQVNALENTAQMDVAYDTRLAAGLQGNGSLASPPTAGRGTPGSVAAKGLVEVNKGVFTIAGNGSSVLSGNDGCVFACMASTARTATFVCRIVSLSNVDCPQLPGECVAGLMARSDLSDDSVDVFVVVSGQNGVQAGMRAAVGQGVQVISQSELTTTTGAIGPMVLTKSNVSPHKNYLRRPLWLQMKRAGAIWTLSTSEDGVHWSKTTTKSLQMNNLPGCWIGLCVSAGNGSFGGKGTVQAVFDNISFTPNIFEQIGQA